MPRSKKKRFKIKFKILHEKKTENEGLCLKKNVWFTTMLKLCKWISRYTKVEIFDINVLCTYNLYFVGITSFLFYALLNYKLDLQIKYVFKNTIKMFRMKKKNGNSLRIELLLLRLKKIPMSYFLILFW